MKASSSGTNGAVSSENEKCTKIGLDVLKENGSAVDAVIATTLCIGTTNMYSSGLGGGGFMLIRSPVGEYSWIDFRDEAPEAAFKDMYKSDPGLAQNGGLSVAIPGELRGLALAHQMYGKLPWERLVRPSIELAETGWIVDVILAKRICAGKEYIFKDPGLKRLFAPNGALLMLGDPIKRPVYAKTLAAIAKEGDKVFYEVLLNNKGWIATALVNTINNAQGNMSMYDFKQYEAKISSPMMSTYRGKTVVSGPPPSSGAVLLEALNILDEFEDFRQTEANTQIMIETFKHVYAQRSYYGDPDDTTYRNISQIAKAGITKEFAAKIVPKIFTDRTFEPKYYDPPFDVQEDHGTMHVSILTEDGYAVALTSTVNLLFGSKLLDLETDIILNDQMDDFSIPGHPNGFGLAPSPYNYIRIYF